MSQPPSKPKPYTLPVFWSAVGAVVAPALGMLVLFWPGLSLDDRAKGFGFAVALGSGIAGVGSVYALKGGQQQAEELHADNRAAIRDVAREAGTPLPPPAKEAP